MAVPPVVDADSTLVRSDPLHEAAFRFVIFALREQMSWQGGALAAGTIPGTI